VQYSAATERVAFQRFARVGSEEIQRNDFQYKVKKEAIYAKERQNVLGLGSVGDYFTILAS